MANGKQSEHKRNGEHHFSWLANGDSTEPTNRAAELFIEKIHEERQKGYGFVPLIGAGFSAPSGAPLVKELKSYLQRCICMALGVAEPDQQPMRPWNPRSDQWPALIERGHAVRPKEHWENLLAKAIHDSQPEDTACQQPPENRAALQVLKEAQGALAEWRTSLFFLSRIMRDVSAYPNSPHFGTLALDAPRPETIDSCFREVLKNKVPALGHKMLATLAGLLRQDLLLTTNFDDLLERAFSATRNPLEIVEMHLRDNLPHWSAVSEVRHLLKLHGGRHSLRADYSLDSLPTEDDKACFLEYFLSDTVGTTYSTSKRPFSRPFRNHLLIIGLSGSERRTRALIEHAWQHLHPDFRVFWVCYGEEDVRNVEHFTRAAADTLDRLESNWQGSNIIRYPYFGYLLLQLYQQIRKTLPPISSVFPSEPYLPYPPLSPWVKRERHHDPAEPSILPKFQDKLVKLIETFQKMPDEQHTLIVATSPYGNHGVMSACGDVFRILEKDNMCLWIDMNDVTSADHLFETIIETAYSRMGLLDWTPCYASDDVRRPRAKEISVLLESITRHCVIFLNARETPGANMPMTQFPVDSKEQPNGWLDRGADSLSKHDDPSACTLKFTELMTDLCRGQTRATIVLLCRQAPRSNNPTPLGRALPGYGEILLLDNREDSHDFDEREVIKKAFAWFARSPDMQRFLHALVLMQRPRPESVIWTNTVCRTTSPHAPSAKELSSWLDKLEEIRLARRKPGGFIWLHSRCRNKIRKHLSDGSFRQLIPRDIGLGWEPKASEPEIHSTIAQWYETVLAASQAPAAVFEIIYHYCCSAVSALRLTKETNALGWASDSLRACISCLKTHSFLIQTRGYPKGSCRRLEHTRNVLCDWISQGLRAYPPDASRPLDDLLREFRIACTEIMRALGREIGEDRQTYIWHSDTALLRLGNKSAKWKGRKSPGRRNISVALHAAATSNRLPWDEWLRWWRWCGMLGIGSRSYDAAESALQKALRYCTTTETAYPLPPGAVDWRALEDPCDIHRNWESVKCLPQPLRVQALRACEQYVALQLLKDNADRRLRDISSKPGNGKEIQRIQQIEDYIKHGRELAHNIRINDLSSDGHDGLAAAWCETRLLIHASVCAGRRLTDAGLEKETMVATAMGLLGDTEGTLRIADRHRYRSESALIELHRAEARLCEAASVCLRAPLSPMKRNSLPLATFVRQFEEWRPRSSAGLQAEQELNQALNTSARSNDGSFDLIMVRRARALVTDAIRFLDRAEPVLKDRRRNVWWNTWFFERRLRAVSYLLWLSLFEPSNPTPLLGFESAAWHTSSVADLLLDISQRMIRIDVYRLATVIDAYTSCARALHVRLTWCSIPDHRYYREREKDMKVSLQAALEQLGILFKARKGYDITHPLYKSVSHYVRTVLTRSARMADQLLC